MATRTDSDCNVGYYGVGLGDLLGGARQIEKPLTLHIAEKDRFSSPEEITKVRDALESNGKATTHLYKGHDHAFARPGGEHYAAPSANLATARTLNFFNQHLAFWSLLSAFSNLAVPNFFSSLSFLSLLPSLPPFFFPIL